MAKTHKPRAGSLQFWPRVRAARILPSVNWSILQKKHKKGLLGFIGYKVGMLRALVRDLTPDSLTKNKQIIVPLTIIECPSIKILAVRFYKNKEVAFDILSENLDKELKRKIKIPKEKQKVAKKLAELEKRLNEFKDIRIIAYSVVKETNLKKTPDISELGLAGNITEKFEFIKKHIDKEIKLADFLDQNSILDIRGVTKGFGFQGPIKRFGIKLKQKKSEKGRRRPGTLGPWHPSRVTFRAPMAGQYGFFTRIHYNSKVLKIGNAKEIENLEFLHYGKIKTDYLLVKGSIQGPAKRPLIFTLPLRERKRIAKKNFEILNLLK